MIPGTVSVGFLHPGQYASCFAESCVDMLLYDLSHNMRMSRDGGWLALRCTATQIVEGRNKLASIICDQSEAEWLFMVDSDMGFGEDTVDALIAVADPVDRPVVGALYFTLGDDGPAPFYGRRFWCTPAIYRWRNNEPHQPDLVPHYSYTRNDVTRCDATGAGCLLIHRSVLEQMRAKFGDEWFDPIKISDKTYGEDLSFCFRLLLLGVPLFVHTGIKTTHDKGGVFLDEDYYERQPGLDTLVANVQTLYPTLADQGPLTT
jgi:hypothetical protein